MKKASFDDVIILPQSENAGLHKGVDTFTFGPLVSELDYGFAHHHRSGRIATNVSQMWQYRGINEPKFQGSYFYGGAFDYHFGHFLAECLGRLHGWESSGRHKIVWCPTYKGTGLRWLLKLPEWQKDILTYCGIRTDDIIFITAPTCIERLLVVESGMWLYQTPSSEQILWLKRRQDVFNKSVNNKSSNSRKIFVSRAKIESVNKGRICGIETIEKGLSAAGYVTIYPEKLSIWTQLSLYAHAEKLVFEDGSALHLLELFGRLDAEIAILPRGKRLGKQFASAIGPRAVNEIWTYKGKVWEDELEKQSITLRARQTYLDVAQLLDELREANFI